MCTCTCAYMRLHVHVHVTTCICGHMKFNKYMNDQSLRQGKAKQLPILHTCIHITYMYMHVQHLHMYMYSCWGWLYVNKHVRNVKVQVHMYMLYNNTFKSALLFQRASEELHITSGAHKRRGAYGLLITCTCTVGHT